MLGVSGRTVIILPVGLDSCEGSNIASQQDEGFSFVLVGAVQIELGCRK